MNGSGGEFVALMLKYHSRKEDKNMSFSLFSVAILLIFFAVVSIEVYRGLKKGFRRALVSLGTTVAAVLVSVLLTYFAAMVLSSLAISLFLRKTSFYQDLVNGFSSMRTLIDAVLSMVIGAFVFIAIFFIVRALINAIVAIIFKKKLVQSADAPEYSEEKNSYFDRNSKALAVVVSVITSVVVTMVITSPVMGTLDVVNRSIGIIEKTSKKTVQSIGEENLKALKKYANDIPGNVFYQFGGRLMFHGTASTDVYGERVHLLAEIDAIDDAAEDFVFVYKVLGAPENVTDAHIDRIYELCDDIDRIELCTGLLADVLSKGSSAWLRGNTYMSIPKPAMNGLIEPAFDEVLEVCSYTDYYSAKPNMITMLKIYAAILESDIIHVDQSNFNRVLEYVNDSGIINRLDAILAENPYMSGISVSSIAMSAVSNHIWNNSYDSEKYEELMYDIADAINHVNDRGYATDEEKASVLASYAKKHIAEYGVTIPDDIASSVAEEILKSCSGSGISSDDVKALFKQYTD